VLLSPQPQVEQHSINGLPLSPEMRCARRRSSRELRFLRLIATKGQQLAREARRVTTSGSSSLSFTVTAHVSARRFVYQHTSLLNALDQGLSLIAAGMADVRIADGDGLTHPPAELYQRMFSNESAMGIRNGEERNKGAALAA
jgi:hypothetical protein